MSRLNYLVRDPISFVGFPSRTTATLVRERVFTMLYRLNCITYLNARAFSSVFV